MKVLHIASGRLYGGVERLLATLAEARGVLESEFALAAPGRLDHELEAAGATVHRLGDVRLRRPAGVWQARARLRAAIGASRPAVAICHAPWPHALFAPVVRHAGVPLVFWQHDRARGRGLVERWAKRTQADLVISNSHYTMTTAAAIQPNVRTEVLSYPVPDPLPAPGMRVPLRESLATTTADIVILMASRLEPWKGHLNLVKALGSMEDVPGWVLWIAGGAQRPHERAYEATLRQAVTRAGLDNRVRWLGERRDIPAIMAAVDIYCQPNQEPEPFGIIFAEALLAGVPVVTVACGGVVEIVDDTCGRLVPPQDTRALAGALTTLVRDPDLRRRLGAAGPSHARERCAPSVVLPRLAQLLGPVVRGTA